MDPCPARGRDVLPKRCTHIRPDAGQIEVAGEGELVGGVVGVLWLDGDNRKFFGMVGVAW
jgi:hypothetical protein